MDGKIIWEKGKQNSLNFYTKKIKYKEQQFNHKFPLNIYFDKMIGDKKEVKIADLGAGMFSTVGNLWYNCDIHLYPSDILADDYRKILDEHKIKPLFPVEKQDMENLTYKDGFFDIVHCVNALDHCLDPFKALREMYRICKTDGWIYLRHGLNMGEQEGYKGLHQWNIKIIEGADCLIWNKDREFRLSDCISDNGGNFYTIMRKEVGNEPKMIVSTFYKHDYTSFA